MKLYFNPRGFPRTTIKSEWKEIWHWKRVTTKQLAERENTQIALLKDDNLPERLRVDILNSMTNPPILIHDRQK
jgi:hypothetical protein